MEQESRDFKYLKGFIADELSKKQDKVNVIYYVFAIIVLVLTNIGLYGMLMNELSERTSDRYHSEQAKFDFAVRDNRIEELEHKVEDLRTKLYDLTISTTEKFDHFHAAEKDIEEILEDHTELLQQK